jgi:Ca2+-binding EF-hand superfamily protein
MLMTLLLATLPALAQTDAQGTANRQPLDANHDGVISKDEAQSRPGLARHFDQIDTNRDGQIDRSELRAWRDQMKSRREQRQQSAAAAEGSSGG